MSANAAPNTSDSVPYRSGCLEMLAATGIAALLLSLGMGLLLAYPLVLMVTAFVAIPTGMGLYHLARFFRIAGWLSAGVAGLVAGAIFPLLDLTGPPSLSEARVDDAATIVDGHFTLLGWFDRLLPVAEFGAAGLVSGLFFWFLLSRRSVGRGTKILAWGLLIASAAIAASVPAMVYDRSCHNGARYPTGRLDGSNSFRLKLPPAEWPPVAEFLKQIARERNWSIALSAAPDTGFPWLDATLCRGPATRISVRGSPGPQGLLVSVESGSGKPDNGLLREFHEAFRRRWPHAVRFVDDMAQPTETQPGWAARMPPAAR